MVADEQTHALPEDPQAVEQFARFFGYENRAAFASDLLRHLTIVQGHYAKLFEGDPVGTAKFAGGGLCGGPDDPRLIEHLASLGFKKPVAVAATIRQWLDGDYRVFRVEATRQAFIEFLPSLVDGLANAEDPDNCDHRLRPLPSSLAAWRPAVRAAQPEP